jgi:rare lipoprotein A
MMVRLRAAICGALAAFAVSSAAFAAPGLESIYFDAGQIIATTTFAYADAYSGQGSASPASAWEAQIVGAMFVGTASTYNPFKPGYKEGGIETASGELYDPNAWTAAIQIDLRNTFGGVRYGREYQPTFALVEAGEKRVIVKINDVGPLMPGRIIDLNEQTMRYFDPSLERGLVESVKVTPLQGRHWIPGPLGASTS